jgi:hypothetical protein
MTCKISSDKSGRRTIGATLVELLMAVGIGTVLMAGLASLIFYTGRSFASLTNYVDLDHNSRNALDTMAREIRQTQRLLMGSVNKLTFLDSDGRLLVYTYDSARRTLIRSKNGVVDQKPLLKECDFLSFSLYQRNPRNGTYDQYPAASAATCKLIQVRWVCSRNLIRAKWNTESVQSAKIVIRNNPLVRSTGTL